MSDINCPYCDAGLEINHDDGFGYDEDILHQQECDKCRKYFVFRTSISFNYEAEKADCLNDKDHKYDRTNTAPKEFSKMRCEYCDDEREMTDKERVGFGIGTKESYFKSLEN